jgi:hypothetical protein
MKSFEQELTEVLNSHNIDTQSNTADFVLAQYVCRCLEAYKEAVEDRDHLAGIDRGGEVLCRTEG